MTADEIMALLVGMAEPAYRGRQVAEWVYRKSARSFAEMTNLPSPLRAQLATRASVGCSQVADKMMAPDGTVKVLLRLADREAIEAVYLPYADRKSVCVSTQVGCAVGCRFCASGVHGLTRDLTAGEIADQVLTLQHETGVRIDHVVFMGVGEPLLNYDAVLSAVRLLNTEAGIGERRITISTVGISAGIHKLAKEKMQVGLAISLHAPTQPLREQLVPAARGHRLTEILDAAREFVRVTRRKVTVEYVLLGGVNDRPQDARKLAEVLRGLHCTVNLIPYNPIGPGSSFRPPVGSAVAGFRKILETSGFTVTQRYKRGTGIDAACGQLRARHVASA